MTPREAFLNIFVYSKFLVGVVALSMLYVSTLLLSVQISYHIYIAMFLFYFGIYTINRQTDIKEDIINRPSRVLSSREGSTINIAIGLVAYLGGLAIMSLYGLSVVLLSLIPIIVVLLYGLKFMPKSFRYRRLKEIPVVKNAAVAFAWTTPITFIPLLYAQMPITMAAWTVWAILGVMVFINTVVFDMRDVHGDEREKIRTIPVVIGVKRTRMLLMGLNLLLGAFIFISAYVGSLPVLGFVILLNTAYAFAYLHLFDRIDKNIVCDVLADGEYLVMAFFVFAGHFLL